jgi:hypothetical protein
LVEAFLKFAIAGLGNPEVNPIVFFLTTGVLDTLEVPFVLSPLEPTEEASKRVILWVALVLDGVATWIGFLLGLVFSVTTFGFLIPKARG